MTAERGERFGKGDEVAGDDPRALMDKLIEGMLAVGAGFAPVDRAGVGGNPGAVQGDVFAVALHGQLLEVGGEALKVLLVGQHGHCLGVEEIIVPDREQPHQHRQVFLERRCAEMFIHLVEAVEELAEVLRADGEHGGKTDGGIHRVAAADPIPEAEHVGGVDAEGGDFFGVGGDGDEMLGHGFFVAAESLEQPGAGAAGIGHGLEGGERF